MVFNRWKKSARDPGSSGEIEGVVRRGLAETTGRLPSERVTQRRTVEGMNPYDQSGSHMRKSQPVASKKSSPAASPYDGAGNPYNSASVVPEKKSRSWSDVPIDTSPKD